ncbi:hypothetical protein J6590_025297 [Homalodisca vitripennis]|nr:hypothetical protein J6590_025297 [Homalodisca vitripennis]
MDSVLDHRDKIECRAWLTEKGRVQSLDHRRMIGVESVSQKEGRVQDMFHREMIECRGGKSKVSESERGDRVESLDHRERIECREFGSPIEDRVDDLYHRGGKSKVSESQREDRVESLDHRERIECRGGRSNTPNSCVSSLAQGPGLDADPDMQRTVCLSSLAVDTFKQASAGLFLYQRAVLGSEEALVVVEYRKPLDAVNQAVVISVRETSNTHVRLCTPRLQQYSSGRMRLTVRVERTRIRYGRATTLPAVCQYLSP